MLEGVMHREFRAVVDSDVSTKKVPLLGSTWHYDSLAHAIDSTMEDMR
jgi:hypothetical protein